MTEQEIFGICEEEIIAAPEGTENIKILFSVRMRITERILCDVAPDLDQERKRVFTKLEDIFPVLAQIIVASDNQAGQSQIVVPRVTIPMMEGYLRMYEQWEWMLNFLLDAYESFPAELQRRLTKPEIVSTLVEAQLSRERLFRSFAAHMNATISGSDIPRIRGTYETIRLAILGIERLQEFKTRFDKDAKCALSYPLFAPTVLPL